MKLSIIYKGHLIFQDSEVILRRKDEIEAVVLDDNDERVKKLFEALEKIIEK